MRKNIRNPRLVGEHCADLKFEMYTNDLLANGYEGRLNDLRDEFEAAGLQVSGENTPEGTKMILRCSGPAQCGKVERILSANGLDREYIDFIMNDVAQHSGQYNIFKSNESVKPRRAKRLNESMNDSIFYNAFSRSFKNLIEAIDGYYERLDPNVMEHTDLPEYPENTLEYGPYDSYTKFYVDGIEIELSIDEEGQNGVVSSFGFVHNANAIVGESYFENIVDDREAFDEFEINLSEDQKRSLIQYMNNATRILKKTNPNDLNESAKPRRTKRLNESMNDSYLGKYFVWICSPEEDDMVPGFDILKSLNNHPNLEIVEGECGDSSGYYKCYGIVTANQLLANKIANRFNKEVYVLQFPSDEEYDAYELFIEFGEDYEEPGLGINIHPISVEDIEISAFESAKPEVKSPFGTVKVNGKKLSEYGKGELRQLLREAKQELKELKKEEKSLGEGCGKREKNKIAKKIEKAEKLVEILEEEIKFNPKKAGAINESKSLWNNFTKWAKLYEAEEDEEESEEEEDSEEKPESEEAELKAILLTVKNIDKVLENLKEAGISEDLIETIQDEEDPSKGKIRIDAEAALILKEYLATLGIDLEEEIGAELVADEDSKEDEKDDKEEKDSKSEDSEESEGKDPEDDEEVTAEDIFGDM